MREFSKLLVTVMILVIGPLFLLTWRLHGADPPGPIGLELLVEAQSISGGTPQEFIFSFVNKTDHNIHLPSPTVECADSFDGTVSLNVKFRPLTPSDQTGEGGGCAGDRFGEWPPILPRIESWQVLPSGKSMSIKADRDRFFYVDGRPGRYEFWATYKPPFVEKLDQELLVGLGIDFPRTVLNSKHLTFDKPR